MAGREEGREENLSEMLIRLQLEPEKEEDFGEDFGDEWHVERGGEEGFYNYSSGEEDTPPENLEFLAGPSPAPPGAVRPNLAERLVALRKKRKHWWVGFREEQGVACPECGKRGKLVYKPLVWKGTVPLELFTRHCDFCNHTVEVNRWGVVPPTKECACQVDFQNLRRERNTGERHWEMMV